MDEKDCWETESWTEKECEEDTDRMNEMNE